MSIVFPTASSTGAVTKPSKHSLLYFENEEGDENSNFLVFQVLAEDFTDLTV